MATRPSPEPRLTSSSSEHPRARGVRDPDPGPAVEERAQHVRPLDEDTAPVGVAVAGRGERPDVATVHAEHQGLVAGGADVDASVVDARPGGPSLWLSRDCHAGRVAAISARSWVLEVCTV